MKELEGAALQEYIRNAISVETDVATQEEAISRFSKEFIEKKPSFVPIPKPDPPQTIDVGIEKKGKDILISAYSIAAAIAFIYSATKGFIGVGLIIVLFFSILCLPLAFSVQKSIKNCEQQNNRLWEQHSLACKETAEKNENQKKLNTQNLMQWENTYNKMHNFMNKPLRETQSVLENVYSADVIYPKYRNLPALTSIYEYLITGRCEGLTGPHGAYNLYEDEVRKDMVISQLSVVIQNLEQIKQNQYMLYQQVKEIQQTTNSIEYELRQIKGYSIQIASLTALNAYYAALNERNTRITMWCNV